MSARGTGDKRRRIVRVLPYVGMIASLLILAAPALVDRLEASHTSEHVSTLSSTAGAYPAEVKARLLDQAQRYNARLALDALGDAPGNASGDASGNASGDASAGASADVEEELIPYEQQLTADPSTMMAWLEIPSIDVKLPIYHGTGEDELSAGVGHMRHSSLPVGGASTHCALTAHSGMVGARMFDDIRLLEPGDVFVIWTLDDPLAYEVVSSETVLPNKMDALRIVQGEDLCTLITCTPYGVNSHRLLVRARRCAYEPEGSDGQQGHISSRDVPLVWAIVALAIVVLLGFAITRVRLRRK